MKKPNWKSADEIRQAEPFKNILFLINHLTDPPEVISGAVVNGKPKLHRKMLSGEIVGWIYDKEIT